MPVLRVPGGVRTFDVLWCDGGVAHAFEPARGIVLLVLERPLPPGVLLAVLATDEQTGATHSVSMTGLDQTKHRTVFAVPVEWSKFELAVHSVGPDGAVDRIALKFDRDADRTRTKPEQVFAITLVDGALQIAVARRAASAGMRLYQKVTDDATRPPATRLADVRRAAFRLYTRSPRSLEGMSADDPDGAPRVFAVELVANTPEAARGLKNTSLWHASHALLAKKGATLGLFESRLTAGLRQLAPDDNNEDWRVVFTVPGAAPGDVLCLLPGLDDVTIALENIAPGTPPTASGSCLTFEIDRNANLSRWPRPFPEHQTLMVIPLGSDARSIADQLKPQLEWLRQNGTGSRAEIKELAEGLPPLGPDDLLARLAANVTSPVILAVAHALLGELIRACPKAEAAEEVAAIADPQTPSFLKRLASPALRLAAEREDIRVALLRLSGGNFDPWRDADGLRPVFEVLFGRADVSPAALFEPDGWYERAGDPLARVAILAIARSAAPNAGLATAQRIVDAGLAPGLADLGADDLDAILSFGEENFGRDAADSGWSDAIFWAASELGEAGADRVMVHILDRLKTLRTGGTPRHLLAFEDVRAWKIAARHDEIAACLGEIRHLLETDTGTPLDAIPGFERDRGPFAGGSDDLTLRDNLGRIRATPLWQGLARRASTSATWPTAARAALLATLYALGFRIEPAQARAQDQSAQDQSAQARPAGREGAGETHDHERLLYGKMPEGDGLLRRVRALARENAAAKEEELRRDAETAGTQIDAAGRDEIRREARDHGGASVVRYVLDEVDKQLRRLGDNVLFAVTEIRDVYDHLQGLNGSARRDSGQRLAELDARLTRLRKDLVYGVESRLKQIKRQNRDELLNDILAIEADLQSAQALETELEQLRQQIEQLRPRADDISIDPV